MCEGVLGIVVFSKMRVKIKEEKDIKFKIQEI